MQIPNFQEDFKEGILNNATPEEMDGILADAWRHFGVVFFRNKYDLSQDNKWLNIIPLRINLEKFTFSKHHLKLLKKEKTTTVKYQLIVIDEEREAIFQKHIQRFQHNIPDSIFNFLGENPGKTPCLALECALYDENQKLYAASYFDVTSNSVSSIYATFDTDYSKKSPGLFTLLMEIIFAMNNQKQFIYLGYAHATPSHYDYKKQFNGLEYYDWEGNWIDFVL